MASWAATEGMPTPLGVTGLAEQRAGNFAPYCALRKCRPRSAIEDIFSKIWAPWRTAGVLPQGALACRSIVTGTKSPGGTGWAQRRHGPNMRLL